MDHSEDEEEILGPVHNLLLVVEVQDQAGRYADGAEDALDELDGQDLEVDAGGHIGVFRLHVLVVLLEALVPAADEDLLQSLVGLGEGGLDPRVDIIHFPIFQIIESFPEYVSQN